MPNVSDFVRHARKFFITQRTPHETKHTDESATPRAGGDVAWKGPSGVEIDTIATTAAVVSAAGGLKFVLEMVKLWIEAGKEQRIKLKKGDVEMELQGTMSNKEIADKIQHFERLTRRETDSDIKIIFP